MSHVEIRGVTNILYIRTYILYVCTYVHTLRVYVHMLMHPVCVYILTYGTFMVQEVTKLTFGC